MSPSNSERRLILRDEILEISYWLYSIAGSDIIFPESISSFGNLDLGEVVEILEELTSEGYYEKLGNGYKLTRFGESEARRRLEEELKILGPSHSSLLELGYIPCGPDCELAHSHGHHDSDHE